MHRALQSVAADPNPNRHIRILIERENQEGYRHDYEGQIPHNVEGDDRLRVAPVGAALLQLAGGGLPHQHGGAAALGGGNRPGEDEGERGGAGRRDRLLPGTEQRGSGGGGGGHAADSCGKRNGKSEKRV